MPKLNLEKIAEFTDMLFLTLQTAGLLPVDLNRPYKDYEKWPKLLLAHIEQSGVETGYIEWESEAMRASAPYFDYWSFKELEKWVTGNKGVFFDKTHIKHLRASIGGRAHQYVYSHIVLPGEVISLAEAERRWGKTNLRGNAKGKLRMWQDIPGGPWRTTLTEMRRMYGPEPQLDQKDEKGGQ